MRNFSLFSLAWSASAAVLWLSPALSASATESADSAVSTPAPRAASSAPAQQTSARRPAAAGTTRTPAPVRAPAHKVLPKAVKKPVKPAAAAAAAAPTLATLARPANIVPAVKPAVLLPMQTPQDFCAQATRFMPSVDLQLCARAQLGATNARSVWGRTVFQRDVVAPSPTLRVLVIGGIHGDERSSSSLVLHWIQLAQQTPANVHWRFVPLINPDGLLLQPPRRTNANGVDLNRNFPTPRWDKEAPIYWANRTKNDPRRYPGPKPLSEPESRWIHDEMERWKPNLIVSVHAPYGVLDFDGPAVPPQRLGRLYLDQVGIYPGSLGNFGGVHKRVPVVTIELPSATAMPSEAETRQMWLDLLRWMGERLGAG